MNTKHAPGPWVIEPDASGGYAIVEQYPAGPGGYEKIAFGIARYSNARFLIQAPAMLAALRRFSEAMKDGQYPELQGIACDAFEILDRIDGAAR